MILTIQNHGPYKIWDANGEPVLDCIWANTETGAVIQYQRYSSGKFILDDVGIARELRTVPAPLRWESFRK